jgi:superfamily I DNA/RNA helicase
MAGFGDTWWVNAKQLDEDQNAAYALPKNKSHLIVGPPGSGKTNILLLRAEYLARTTQPNIRVVVFTRTLQEFIRQGTGRRKLPAENVVTHIKFFRDLLWEHDVRDALPTEFDKMRDELVVRLKKLILKEHLEDSFQALLLDEVQDYKPEELRIFRSLAKHLFVAGDFRQRVYKTKSSLEGVQKLVDNTQTLQFHYRNGKKICALADALMDGRPNYTPMLPTSKYDEDDKPADVFRYECAHLEEQCNKAVDKIATQLKAYPDEMLGIICPRKSALETIWGILQSSPLKDLILYQRSGEYDAFDPGKPICLCSVPAAKGLEFRTVHILGADLLKKEPLPREKAYMAVTRAKTDLSIYSVGPLIGPFEAALASVNPRPEPSLNDILSDGDA